MELSQRLGGYNTICGIQIDLAGVAVPSSVDYVERFYGSLMVNADLRGVYHGGSSVRFRESEKIINGTTIYEQEVQLQFPNHDAAAVERINKFKQAKYLFIKNTHGQELVLGRNDHRQNRRPEITVNRDEQFAYVQVFCQSVSSIGYADTHVNTAGLPHLIPIYLFN